MVGYSLKKDDVANLGMLCGGDVKVFFQYLHGEKELPLQCCLKAAAVPGQDAWLIRRFEGHKVTAMDVYDKKGLLLVKGFRKKRSKICESPAPSIGKNSRHRSVFQGLHVENKQ